MAKLRLDENRTRKSGRGQPTYQAAHFCPIPVDLCIFVRQFPQLCPLVHHIQHVGVDVDVLHAIRVGSLNSIELLLGSLEVYDRKIVSAGSSWMDCGAQRTSHVIVYKCALSIQVDA